MPSIEQLEQSVPRDRSEAAPLPGISIDVPTQRTPVGAQGLTFELRDVIFEGAGILPDAQLRPLYADLIGRTITLDQAFEVVREAQALHRDAGYIFTRVIAPQQTIEDGIFRITVVTAKVRDVVITAPAGPIGPPEPLIKRIGERLEGRVNPTLGELERVLLLINDIPGIEQATAVPRAGSAEGEVDIYINVVRDPFSGVVFADNRQSPILGPGLIGFSGELASYTSGADSTKVSYFNSFGDESDDESDLRERHTVQIDHQRNFGSDGLMMKLFGLYSKNKPGEDVARLDLDGEQLEGRLTLEYPLKRTRPFSLWIYGGFEYRDSQLDTSGSTLKLVDDKLRIGLAGARGLQRDAFGYTEFEIELRNGFDIFDATSDDQRNRSRFDGEAEFTLIKALLEREVFIPGTDDKLSLFALATGQYSFDPLLSAEEFGIGGSLIGRGYDPSEYTGDRGFGISGEIRYRFFFDAAGEPIGLQIYAFGDHGRIENIEEGEPDSADVTSFGGGVRLSLPYQININLEVAQPVDDLLRTEDNETRFFFNFVKSF